MPEHHGHWTYADGHHEPLTKEEAESIHAHILTVRAKRAEKLPTAEDALRAISEAQDRLRELGWWLGGLSIKAGDKCAVAQPGSTGMWAGHMDNARKYVHFGDCVTTPEKAYLKPLADITYDERLHIAEGDKSATEFQRRIMRSF